MAYSDYGGYAYRNGERVEDRSDAVITPELTNAGAPGVYPGFVAMGQGVSMDDFEKTRQASVNGHVVLGDGPVMIAMYKQSGLSFFKLEDGAFRTIDMIDVGIDLPAKAISEYGGARYFSPYDVAEQGLGMVSFEIDGHTIEALFEITDNHYQYVRLTQPDGTEWTGFSGYGVGAGLEECGFGYDNSTCVSRLFEVFS